MNIINNHKFDSLVFDPLREVDEHLVVVFERLAMGEDDIFTDLLLRNFVFILDQEVLFNFIESFLIKRLARHQVQALSLQTTALLGQERLQQKLDCELSFAGTTFSEYFVQFLRHKAAPIKISEHVAARGKSMLPVDG